ncbi:hypothetical protein PLICRDRAFT_603261 [Plicaturopsis crispa FD-325 SS-3]|nr:hypothetical protein PLICRDRAFT_603261 [Plicaturopsis crispa FD-325 SS-3]
MDCMQALAHAVCLLRCCCCVCSARFLCLIFVSLMCPSKIFAGVRVSWRQQKISCRVNKRRAEWLPGCHPARRPLNAQASAYMPYRPIVAPYRPLPPTYRTISVFRLRPPAASPERPRYR